MPRLALLLAKPMRQTPTHETRRFRSRDQLVVGQRARDAVARTVPRARRRAATRSCSSSATCRTTRRTAICGAARRHGCACIASWDDDARSVARARAGGCGRRDGHVVLSRRAGGRASWCWTRAPASHVFYDLDTPVTLERARARRAPVAYLGRATGSADYDLVLSYTGGALARRAARSPRRAARRAAVRQRRSGRPSPGRADGRVPRRSVVPRHLRRRSAGRRGAAVHRAGAAAARTRGSCSAGRSIRPTFRGRRTCSTCGTCAPDQHPGVLLLVAR